MAKVVFKRPVIVDGAFYGKGTVGEFEKLGWFLSGLIKSGAASLVDEVKPGKPAAPAPEAAKGPDPSGKEPASAPEKQVKPNARKRNVG